MIIGTLPVVIAVASNLRDHARQIIQWVEQDRSAQASISPI